MDKKVIDLGRQALQVLVCFDGAVLAAHQLIAGQTLAVGADTEYPVGVPGLARWDLAGIDVAGPYVQFPASAEGEVRLGRTRRPLGELVRGGWCAARNGLYRHALVDGEQATVTVGPLTVQVRREEASYRVPRPRYRDRDWSAHRFTAVVAGGVALLLLLAFSVPPEPALASGSVRLDQATVRRLTLHPPVEPARPKVTQATPPPGGGAPPPRVAVGGGRRPGHRFSNPSNPGPVRPAGSSAGARGPGAVTAEVHQTGVLAILGAARGGGVLGSLLDRGNSALGEADSVFAGLIGSQTGDTWGPGAGTIVGHGPGGPGGGGTCTGPNCLGTIGVGTGPCPGGHCGGLPGGRGPHGPVLATRTPRPVIDVAPTSLIVSKEIDKEVIRRVIRTRMNEIRFCYEKGLMQEADLEGKLVVSFLILRDGRVTAVTPRESSIGNAAVVRCVVEAVGRLTFPVPPSASVAQVTYPFVFRHAAGAP
jgi:hypothetical protein